MEELQKLVNSIFSQEQVGFALSANTAGRLSGVAFSSVHGVADFIDLETSADREAAVRQLGQIFENGLIDKTTHDLKYALCLLEPEGIKVEQVVDDTQIQAYLLHSDRTKLEVSALAQEYLGGEIEVRSDSLVAQAADLASQLAGVLNRKIEQDELQFDYQKEKLDFLYRQVELPLVPLLRDMERAGFRVDPEVLAGLSVEMEKEIENLSQQIYRLAGREFNIASPSQLGEVFEELNFEVSRRTSTGKISTSRDVLEELAEKYELPQLVIEHRELAKLKGTYVDAFPALIDPADGRIHTTLNQTATATGRISSTDPNLQNIPIRTEMGRRIRRAFIPAPGHVLLSADYSQIELRLLAHITRDPVMLETFRQGEDIHTRTAREVFKAQTAAELKEARRLAKIVNFGIAYVIGPFGLAQRVGLSRQQAKQVIEDYYRTYPGVKQFMDQLPDQARANKCAVRSIFGRVRKVPDLDSRGSARARAEREAINMPMQGSASDIVKMAMLRVSEALRREKLKARMILQVHDELVFELPENEVELTSKVVKSAMESAAQIDVPLLVEIGIGKNWMDAKP
jgi:DNA polymerase-1